MVLDELLNGGSVASSGNPGEEPNRKRAPPHTTISRFMPTSRRIVQFSDGVPAPPGARIVYIDGAFDLFHPGHVEILKVLRDSPTCLNPRFHDSYPAAAKQGTRCLINTELNFLRIPACKRRWSCSLPCEMGCHLACMHACMNAE